LKGGGKGLFHTKLAKRRRYQGPRLAKGEKKKKKGGEALMDNGCKGSS